MNLDRINELFESGYITKEEQYELVTQKLSVKQQEPKYSYRTLALALCGFLLSISLRYGSRKTAILENDNQRLMVGTILMAAGIYAFFKFRMQAPPLQNKAYLAYIGIGIIIAQLILTVPLLLMSIS